MRPLPEFPYAVWHDFQNLLPIAPLIAGLPELKALKGWPAPETWQNLAEKRELWDTLGQTLVFTLEQKLGQRAKRKQKEKLVQLPVPGGRSYEASILEKQEIPTRAQNLHDFFNALIWLNFPLSKFALHKKAYEVQMEWSRANSLQKRCPLADRLTCFDEGGIVYELKEGEERRAVEELIQSRNDALKQEFAKENADSFTLFGHGMMEVMMKGNAAIYASCIILDHAEDNGGRDEKLARYLDGFGERSPDHGAIQVGWLLDI